MEGHLPASAVCQRCERKQEQGKLCEPAQTTSAGHASQPSARWLPAKVTLTDASTMDQFNLKCFAALRGSCQKSSAVQHGMDHFKPSSVLCSMTWTT
eukprot:1161517-Pelagomonas_calceolata.AAC.11